MMNDREALIALNAVPGLGAGMIHRFLSALPSVEEAFGLGPASIREILDRWATPAVVEGIGRAADGKGLAIELAEAGRLGVRVVTLFDPDYPAILKQITDPPPVLYLKGDLLKEDEAAVAVVGTRAATPYGLWTARQLARDLAGCGITVVSGLAEGIDGAAHEGALEARGRTLAVLGHGLRTLFPSHHEDLAGRVAERGALISEFPIWMEPSKENFPRRNRVIAGLSLGVVVVEAPLRSGALITAREAMEQGREVFAVPGPVSSTRSKGTHRLLKDGAKLVEDARDVLEELAPQIKGRLDLWKGERPDAAPPAPLLSEEESAVYQAIPVGGGILVGALAESVVFNPSRLLPILTSLELKGLVRPMPGQGYSRAV